MSKRSAGLLIYRTNNGSLEVFLAHPGGPFYARRDLGVWTIPKGEFENEKPLAAARREFREETGFGVRGPFIELMPVKMKSGKLVLAWAAKRDIDPAAVRSNTFQMGFGSRPGRVYEFPEIDRAEWFSIATAIKKIHPEQVPFLTELVRKIGYN